MKFKEEEDISGISLSPNDQNLITAHYPSLLLKQWSNWKQLLSEGKEMESRSNTQKTSQKPVRTWKALHTSPIVHMAFDRSSSLLATSAGDYTTKVWDLTGQYCTHNLKGATGITRWVRFYPDLGVKQEIVLGGDDAKLKVFDLNTSRLVELLEGHFSAITCFEYLGDKWEQLLSASRDKVMILWDTRSYSILRTITLFESIESFQILPCLKSHAITMGNTGLLKIWCLQTGHLVYSQDKSQSLKPLQPDSSENDLDSCIIQSLFIESISTLVLLTVDESILFIKVDLDLAKKLDLKQKLSSEENENFFHTYKQYIGNHGEILDVEFVDVSERLLAVATNSPDLKIYDIHNWDCKILKGHTDLIICLAAYKDHVNKICFLASSSKNSEIRIWRIWSKDSNNNKNSMNLSDYSFDLVQVCLGHTHDVGALSFSKQAFNFLVSGSIDTTIKVWRIEEDKSKMDPSIRNHSSVKLNVAFTFKAHEKDINCVCVSSNDKLIASGSTDRTAKIWDCNNGACLAVLRGHRRGIWSIAFSSVEQIVATSSADGTIKLWSLGDFSCIKTFEGHNTSVLKLSFLNHSTQLISTASDGLLKLWNIKTNACVATFDAHDDKCWSLLISENEKRVVTGGADGKLILWLDVSDEILDQEINKREEFLLKDQELENFMMEKKWNKALRLALVLDKPFKCYKIIKEILENGSVNQDGTRIDRSQLEKAILSLRQDLIRSLLKYAADWNSNTKYCYLAQIVFELVFRHYQPQFLLGESDCEFPTQLVEQFMPYTERHYARLNRLTQQIMFMDFAWKSMKIDGDDVKEKTKTNNCLS